MVLKSRKQSKQITLSFLTLLLTVSLVLTVPTTIVKAGIIWDETFGGGENEEGFCIVNTTDGGYIIVGFTESFGAGDSDVWLIKTDENGTMMWNQTFGGIDDDEGRCVAQTSDGGYIITGSTSTFGAGWSDVWLIKTDENGNMMWDKTYGGTGIDEAECVQQTSDGGYIITGELEFEVDSVYHDDIWLIKTDENGDMMWNQTFGGTDDEEANWVLQTSDGGYIIVGYTWSYGTAETSDVWLIKTDEEGNKEWDKTYDKGDFDVGECVLQTADGNYIIVGTTISYDVYYSDIWFLEVSEEEGFFGGTFSYILIAVVIGLAVFLAIFLSGKMKRGKEGPWEKGVDEDLFDA